MGSNAWCQLGDGTTINRSTPEKIVANGVRVIAAGASNSLFIKNDGSLWGIGDNDSGQLGDGTTTQQSTPEQIMSGDTASARP
jgi:alpha-tubulin suppressor-like RCC1 family protein